MSDFDEHKIELANELRKANAMIARLEEKLDVAVEALEFYGNRKNWYASDDQEDCEYMEIDDSDGYRLEENHNLIGGNRAREALNKIRGEK